MKKQNTEVRLRTSLDGQSFLLRLEEQGIIKPFPWYVISSRELATAFKIHLQTVANWQIRGQGPVAEPKGLWRGNRKYFTIANIIAWLDGKEAWEVYQEWIGKSFHEADNMPKQQCKVFIAELIASNAYQQPKWKRKRRTFVPEFSFAGGV